MAERVFVWAGGVLFVLSLAYCAGSYAVLWSVAAGGGWGAVAFNAVLLSVFAAHHSVFARESVKRWLARRVPDSLQRSVYVWTASLLLLGACAAWRPIGREMFHARGMQIWLHAAVQLLGVAVSVLAVRGLDPLELAGIRPLGTGRQPPVDRRRTTVGVRTTSDEARVTTHDSRLTAHGPYRVVRHPLYFGWILIVFGPAHMTGDRLAFAVLTTVYLVIAIPWEERSLVRTMGDEYVRYQRRVRWRLIPFIY